MILLTWKASCEPYEVEAAKYQSATTPPATLEHLGKLSL